MNQSAIDIDIQDSEKAAILLLSMGEQAAAKVLQRLSRDEVQTLSRTMARLSNISTNEARWILTQFFDQYRQQSGISAASREYLEKALDLALGDKLARSMLDSIYGDVVSKDIQRLQWVPPEVLARFFRHEHPQMQAVMLAFLPPDTATSVLDHMPEDSHDELLYRVANLKEISDHVISDLHETLERCLAYVAEQSGARIDGVRQAADILNRYEGDRGQVMDMLNLHDEKTASAIKDNMFDFMVLSRQSSEVLQSLIQELPGELLAIALKGAETSVRRAIFGAMPKRMAQSLEIDMQGLGPLPVRKVEKARAQIMSQVRDLYESGQIQLQLFEEKTVS